VVPEQAGAHKVRPYGVIGKCWLCSLHSDPIQPNRYGLAMFELRAEPGQRQVLLHIEPPLTEPLSGELIRQQLAQSTWNLFRLDEAALGRAVQLSVSRPNDIHDVLIAEAVDAALHITVSSDQMSAQVSYTPAQGGKKLDELAVIQALKAAKVLKGIHADTMRLLASNPPQSLQRTIAEGKPPTDAVAGKLDYLVTPLQRRQLVPQVRDDGSLDMRELGGVDAVAEDQPLLRRVLPVPGQNGYNVLGAVVPAPLPADVPLIAGDGTRIGGDDPHLLIAALAGVPIEIHGGMRIDSVLTLSHDIDLSTGNINYRGSVVIKGDITHGMSVKATGDILIQGSVEPSRIEAGGNITITEGVLGSQLDAADADPASYELQIIAGGTLSARHAQHAYLKAASVQIGNQLFHCLVQADGPVQVGKAGGRNTLLVGGFVQARECISAGIVGASSHSKTVLDFTPMFAAVAQKQKQLQTQLAGKTALAQSLQTALARNKLRANDPQAQKLKNTIDAMAVDVDTVQAAINACKGDIDRLKKNISVKVFERLYPGVEIRVLGGNDAIHVEHSAGTFRFDDGKLVFDR